MTTASAGIFNIDYKLRTNAAPGADIQFGMDFTLTQTTTTEPLPLCQLIYPATAVGTNLPGQWNVDNHRDGGSSVACLVFAGAEDGRIRDIPTELSRRNRGILTTKFAVYRIEIDRNAVEVHGVTFGYSVDTGQADPQTWFTGIEPIKLPKDQQRVILVKCPQAKFR